jgi:hypothetical protein
MRIPQAALALLVALSAAAAAAAAGPGIAPTPFQLVFDGHHVVATFPSPAGLSHVGTFTTNDPLCPSGTGGNVAETDVGVATRVFTCDGSGATFTAKIWPQIEEHEGSGWWQIVSGTGPLADLRGKGTFSSVLVSGDLNDFITVVFRSTWTGTVALDATPPTLTLTKATATRLKRPAGMVKVSLALALGDSGGGPVSYTVTLVDPATLDALFRKSGSTSAGSIGWTPRVKPPARARVLRVEVDASDGAGNESTVKQAIPLRK